jgi:hypothetical protein
MPFTPRDNQTLAALYHLVAAALALAIHQIISKEASFLVELDPAERLMRPKRMLESRYIRRKTLKVSCGFALLAIVFDYFFVNMASAFMYIGALI